MELHTSSYVPTLAVRASEMNGLEFLPGATKDRLAPCFLLAPWANSASLEKTIERIERAFPNRLYFLDIDRDYVISNPESAPQSQLLDLLNPNANWINWVTFVAQHNNILPCLQTRDQSADEIRSQIRAYQSIGRNFCVRITNSRYPNNLDEVIDALVAVGSADYTIILEGGWTRDPLTLSAWFDGIIAGGLSRIDAQIPIVVSCTSMPKMYSNMAGITEYGFTNRQLVDQVARRFSNRTSIVYGDWGSTRPREATGFANRPYDRIDYPTGDAWYIARDRDNGWTFDLAANQIIKNSGVWDGNLGIWGEQMIMQTSINPEIGINTAQKNVAARVNIHLHRQAFYNDPNIGGMNFDEDWED